VSDYQVIDTNADNVSGCSHCGNKNANNLGHRRKTNWLRDRYAEGLEYNAAQEVGDGNIEYAFKMHATVAKVSVIHCCGYANTRERA